MKLTRRHFIAAATLGISTMIALKAKMWPQRASKQTAKFLDRDGKLVEVDLKHLPFKRLKASQSQVMNWIHNQQS